MLPPQGTFIHPRLAQYRRIDNNDIGHSQEGRDAGDNLGFDGSPLAFISK